MPDDYPADEQRPDATVPERLREESEEASEPPLPADLVEACERLIRLARQAVDDAAAEAYREDLETRLGEYGYTARVREEDTGAVLVLHPEEWVADGTIELEEIGDVDRAVERRLSGVGDATEFDRVDAANREIVDAVAERRGPVHGANATAFADFMGNHYVRRVETATDEELREFVEHYFPRNAFPSPEQRRVLDESLRLVFEVAGRDPPRTLRESDGSIDRTE